MGIRLNSWLRSFSSVKILEMTLREERQVKIATGSILLGMLRERAVGVADCRHAFGEAGERYAMKRADRSGRL